MIVIIMSLSLLQSELGEGISLMPAAIKHEISVFILPLCLGVHMNFTHSLSGQQEPFPWFHLTPRSSKSFFHNKTFLVPFISRKPEQLSRYFIGRHMIVHRQQQAF